MGAVIKRIEGIKRRTPADKHWKRYEREWQLITISIQCSVQIFVLGKAVK